MDLVVDANVLVGELLRPRGRALLQRPEFTIYAVPKVLDETCYELRRRVTIMKDRGRLNEIIEQELLDIANGIIDNYITLVAESFYTHLEAEARKRIPRDPNDWETVALALALPAAIWTEDYDFFGCGWGASHFGTGEAFGAKICRLLSSFFSPNASPLQMDRQN